MSEEHHSLQSHTSHVTALRFTSDGSTLVSSGMDNAVKLWSVEDDWELTTSLEAHEKSVNDFDLSPDQQTLVTVSTDKLIKVWSFPDLEPIETLSGHKNTVAAVRFSPDGKLFATASYDTTVKVWDRETLECLHTLKGHKRNVTSLSWLKNGSLASSGLGDDIILWKLPSGDQTQLQTGHKSSVVLGGITPDGQKLISAGYEGQIKLWSTQTWQTRHSFEPGAAGHLCLALAPHGTMLAIGSEKSVALWSLETFEELTELPIKPKGVYGVCFSPDTQWLAVAGSDKRIRIWAVDSTI